MSSTANAAFEGTEQGKKACNAHQLGQRFGQPPRLRARRRNAIFSLHLHRERPQRRQPRQRLPQRRKGRFENGVRGRRGDQHVGWHVNPQRFQPRVQSQQRRELGVGQMHRQRPQPQLLCEHNNPFAA